MPAWPRDPRRGDPADRAHFIHSDHAANARGDPTRSTRRRKSSAVTGHTVRTTSTVQSALDALEPGQSSTAVLAFQPEAAWTTPPAWLRSQARGGRISCARPRARWHEPEDDARSPRAPSFGRAADPAPRCALRASDGAAHSGVRGAERAGAHVRGDPDETAHAARSRLLVLLGIGTSVASRTTARGRARRLAFDDRELGPHHPADKWRRHAPVAPERSSRRRVGRARARLVAHERSRLAVRAKGEVGGDPCVPGAGERDEICGVDALPHGLPGPEAPDHSERDLVRRVRAEPNPLALLREVGEPQRLRPARCDRRT